MGIVVSNAAGNALFPLESLSGLLLARDDILLFWSSEPEADSAHRFGYADAFEVIVFVIGIITDTCVTLVSLIKLVASDLRRLGHVFHV